MPAALNSDNNSYASEVTNSERQQLSAFGLLNRRLGDPDAGHGQALTIAGIEVRLTDAFVSAGCSNTTIGVELYVGRRHDVVDRGQYRRPALTTSPPTTGPSARSTTSSSRGAPTPGAATTSANATSGSG